MAENNRPGEITLKIMEIRYLLILISSRHTAPVVKTKDIRASANF